MSTLNLWLCLKSAKNFSRNNKMNSITVAGIVGNSELKQLNSGDAILNFSIADSEGRDKPTIWWNCSLFGKRAESLAPYVQKGSKVTAVGKVSQRQYTDKNGIEKTSMEIRVNEIALQGGKEQAESKPAPKPAPEDDTDLPF
jgi:single-strand DNA-binding protein